MTNSISAIRLVIVENFLRPEKLNLRSLACSRKMCAPKGLSYKGSLGGGEAREHAKRQRIESKALS
jgi:hypothetical protein